MEDGITDRERILMRIIEGLSATQLLAPACRGAYGEQHFRDSMRDAPYMHFAYWSEPQPGDLVLAKTGQVSEWKVGFYVRKLGGDFGGAVIREIGTDRECNYSNESFVPIVGLSEIDLLEGERRDFYRRVIAAFRMGDEYLYRFGGIKFDGDVATVTVREAHGGFGKPSQPFDVQIKMRKRMAVKAILAVLREGGYGTKSFRPELSATPAHQTEE